MADPGLAWDRRRGWRRRRHPGGVDRPRRLRARQRHRGLASIIVIWRFSGTRTGSAAAEQRAQRWVAVSFFLLAPYVAAEAVETMIEGAAAETSWLGIGLTAGTLLICPWLGLIKRRVAEKLGSRATYGEGTQNLLCALLAAAV